MRGQCRWGFRTEGSAFGMRAVVHRGVVSRSFAPEQSLKRYATHFSFIPLYCYDDQAIRHTAARHTWPRLR